MAVSDVRSAQPNSPPHPKSTSNSGLSGNWFLHGMINCIGDDKWILQLIRFLAAKRKVKKLNVWPTWQRRENSLSDLRRYLAACLQ